MASVIASVSKQLDHVNKALAESSIAWPLCRNQEASSLEAGELRLEGGGAQGNNQAHCKIMYKAILLFLAKYAFYLNNKQEVNEVKSNLSQIGFDVASIHQMLSGLEGKVELLESKQSASNPDIKVVVLEMNFFFTKLGERATNLSIENTKAKVATFNYFLLRGSSLELEGMGNNLEHQIAFPWQMAWQ
ncbi:hypothetical protein CJ030_MR6G024795 [Morella rubra]|uniref:Uncharacterized protein n=1 Tax=Morella rubra TaxID=262757 RepID=A0A6A1V7C6_9ROSI|nr:hypothetical protein CJ030_MR6G024795 [Morella rubra]